MKSACIRASAVLFLNICKLFRKILAILAATSYKEITGSMKLKNCQM